MKMKDKKAAQDAVRKEHLARRQETKRRRQGNPVLDRPEGTRAVKPTILIVCEGRNTEPSYFNAFRLSTATVKAVGKGYNTTTLVQEAARLAALETYEKVWCVFDKDTFPAHDFNNAIVMATAQDFGVGYSNQAFEYWLLLHFEDHQGGGMPRTEYYDALNQYLGPLGCAYDGKKGKTIHAAFFELLMAKPAGEELTRTELAIQRARRIYDALDHASPATEESSTTVFRIVEELLKYV